MSSSRVYGADFWATRKTGADIGYTISQAMLHIVTEGDAERALALAVRLARMFPSQPKNLRGMIFERASRLFKDYFEEEARKIKDEYSSRLSTVNDNNARRQILAQMNVELERARKESMIGAILGAISDVGTQYGIVFGFVKQKRGLEAAVEVG